MQGFNKAVFIKDELNQVLHTNTIPNTILDKNCLAIPNTNTIPNLNPQSQYICLIGLELGKNKPTLHVFEGLISSHADRVLAPTFCFIVLCSSKYIFSVIYLFLIAALHVEYWYWFGIGYSRFLTTNNNLPITAPWYWYSTTIPCIWLIFGFHKQFLTNNIMQ
jgi:hypothetical protein